MVMDKIFAALLTPVDTEGKLDVSLLVKLVKHELDKGVEGFYCCGSSGEGLLFEKEERKKIVETVTSEVSNQVPVIVHTGALSTVMSVELSLHAQSCGAKAVSLIPPIYYSYTQEEVEHHYMSVVEALEIGVIVYNIPQFTGINFSKRMNSKLLDDSRIVGIKHTSMNLYELERIHEAFPEKTLYNGFDEMYLYSLSAGAQATIGTTVNICPKIFKEIRENFKKNEIEKARETQSTLNTFIEVMVENGIFPSTKYAMELLGVPCGSCRLPFIPLGNQQKKNVEHALTILKRWL